MNETVLKRMATPALILILLHLSVLCASCSQTVGTIPQPVEDSLVALSAAADFGKEIKAVVSRGGGPDLAEDALFLLAFSFRDVGSQSALHLTVSLDYFL